MLRCLPLSIEAASGVVDGEVIGDESSHTSTRMTGRIEVVARVSGRRFWTVEQKLLMLRDAFGPGGSVRAAIERHEVTSGLLYTWRKKAMSGLLFDVPPRLLAQPTIEPAPLTFAEVHVAEPVSLPAPQPSLLPSAVAESAGRIGIELPSGIKLSVDAAVDADALGRVLDALSR